MIITTSCKDEERCRIWNISISLAGHLTPKEADHVKVIKLVWTKRIETGEVVTAQHWKNGRELNHEEMSSNRVAALMKKIHSSGPLLTMLKKIGMKPMLPDLLLNKIQSSLSPKVNAHHT